MNKIVVKQLAKKMLKKLIPGEEITDKTIVKFHLTDDALHLSINGDKPHKRDDEGGTGEFFKQNMGIDKFEKIVGYLNKSGLYAEIHHEKEGEKVKTIFKL